VCARHLGDELQLLVDRCAGTCCSSEQEICRVPAVRRHSEQKVEISDIQRVTNGPPPLTVRVWYPP
jgi:hypothetical protein